MTSASGPCSELRISQAPPRTRSPPQNGRVRRQILKASRALLSVTASAACWERAAAYGHLAAPRRTEPGQPAIWRPGLKQSAASGQLAAPWRTLGQPVIWRACVAAAGRVAAGRGSGALAAPIAATGRARARRCWGDRRSGRVRASVRAPGSFPRQLPAFRWAGVVERLAAVRGGRSRSGGRRPGTWRRSAGLSAFGRNRVLGRHLAADQATSRRSGREVPATVWRFAAVQATGRALSNCRRSNGRRSRGFPRSGGRGRGAWPRRLARVRSAAGNRSFGQRAAFQGAEGWGTWPAHRRWPTAFRRAPAFGSGGAGVGAPGRASEQRRGSGRRLRMGGVQADSVPSPRGPARPGYAGPAVWGDLPSGNFALAAGGVAEPGRVSRRALTAYPGTGRAFEAGRVGCDLATWLAPAGGCALSGPPPAAEFRSGFTVNSFRRNEG